MTSWEDACDGAAAGIERAMSKRAFVHFEIRFRVESAIKFEVHGMGVGVAKLGFGMDL